MTDSTWTLDALKEHLESMIDERDRRYEQHFDAQEKAVNAALVAAKDAVIKAEVAAEKRFDAANEFRGQLADQAQTFMPRLEAEQRMGYTGTLVGSLSSRLDKLEGRSTGLSAGWGYLVGAAGVLLAIASIFIK